MLPSSIFPLVKSSGYCFQLAQLVLLLISNFWAISSTFRLTPRIFTDSEKDSGVLAKDTDGEKSEVRICLWTMNDSREVPVNRGKHGAGRHLA